MPRHEGWKEWSLRDIGEWRSGGTPSKGRPDYWNGSVPWVSPKDMKVFALRDTLDHISERALSDGARHVPAGSIFIVVRGMILAHTFPVCLAEQPMAFNQDVKAIVTNSSVDGRFLAHWLHGRSDALLRLVTEATHGTKRIDLRDLLAHSITLPPLPEQRRIAEILDTVDEAIRKTEEIITKLKQVKQGLLHDLLTRGIDDNGELRDPDRHPEQFKDSPLGRIPKAWEPVELGDLVSASRPIVYGILMPGQGHPGGVPVVKVKDIKNGVVAAHGLLLTSPAIDYQYRRSRLAEGDLLFTIRGTVGRTAFVPSRLHDANITQDTARIGLVRGNPDFVREYLSMPRPRGFIETHTIGVAVKGINLRDVRRIPLALPAQAEADGIASRLLGIRRRVAMERAQASKLRLLKHGLMEDLLSGSIRVTALLEEPAE
ncbi:MAG: restriction endonuclease subunit S [Sandaracinaceae bacterium]